MIWNRMKLIPWRKADRSNPSPVLIHDPLQQFLASCTEADAKSRVRSVHLYEAFDRWCQESGRRPWSHKGFSKAMLDAGFAKVARDGIWWVGLSLALPKTDGAR